MKVLPVSRRTFIKGAGSTTIGVGFAILLPSCGSDKEYDVGSRNPATELLSWVVINPDNSATIRVPQTELGQGVSTTIPQILADELDLEWSRVSFEFYDPRVNATRKNVFVWTTTVSSSSAHYLFDPARVAAAQIKAALIKAAAANLRIPAGELTAVMSRVEHGASGRSLSYAELANDAANLISQKSDKLVLKTKAERTLIGRPVAQFDLSAITQGSKIFGIDVELAGMRYAVVRQSPVYGGKLTDFEGATLSGLPGNPTAVQIDGAHIGYNSPVPEGEDPELWAAAVRTDDAIAVVADSWWQAKTALEALPTEWSASAHQSFSSARLTAALVEKVHKSLPITKEKGNLDKALDSAAERKEAVYSYPFMDPAPLEPMNCTALVDGNEVHVWTNSQYPDDAWRIAYELGDVAPENAHLHLVPAGGGFGRRLHNDFVYQAMQIAKQNPGTPIKLLATREESTKHSYYAPLTVARFEGGIDPEGEVIAWSCRVASGFSANQAYGAARIPFNIPNVRFEYERDQSTPVPFGWMRGVGFTQHLWMNFSFLDELRLLRGADPVSFYRALLDPKRLATDSDNYEIAVDRCKRNIRLLDYAASESSWNSSKPTGTGRGLCVSDSDYFPGYTSSTKAAIVDVSFGEDGLPIVERVFIAIDAGTIINPDVVHAQLEGGIAYALSTALFSEITVEHGQVQQSNFHDYPILKMDRMPKVDIAILPSDGPPLSVGEDAVPVTIAALVNAIADAGRPRIRKLPIATGKHSVTA